MGNIEKYISEALLKDSPKKKLNLKIKERSITPEHLSQRVVDEVIIPLIDSIETSGMLPEDKAKLDALPTSQELTYKFEKKQDKLTDGWVVRIENEEAGSSGTQHKPKLKNELGSEVEAIATSEDPYSHWSRELDKSIPTTGLVKNKLEEAIADFITKNVDNLDNYYKKSEVDTYIRTIYRMMATLHNFEESNITVVTPPAPESASFGVIYLVATSVDNIYDMYIKIENLDGTYDMLNIGTKTVVVGENEPTIK